MNKLQLSVSPQLPQNLPFFPNGVIVSARWQRVISEANNFKTVDSLMALNAASVRVGLPVPRCHRMQTFNLLQEIKVQSLTYVRS